MSSSSPARGKPPWDLSTVFSFWLQSFAHHDEGETRALAQAVRDIDLVEPLEEIKKKKEGGKRYISDHNARPHSTGRLCHPLSLSASRVELT